MSADQSDIEQLQHVAATLNAIMRDKLFRHYKGGLYRVTDVAVLENTGEVVVVYRGISGRWVRTYDNFMEKVDGVERFKLVLSDDVGDGEVEP